MVRKVDFVIAGGGAVGTAVAIALKRLDPSVSVLLLERFRFGHDKGSSHGETRITRKAIGEGEIYTPLALRSYDLWREVEHALQLPRGHLLNETGGIIIGPAYPDGTQVFHGKTDFLGTTRRAAIRHNILHEWLNADELRKRFPHIRVTDGDAGYYEPEAGVLYPERCVEANAKLAGLLGVEIEENAHLGALWNDGARTILATSRGNMECGKLILAAGAWNPQFLPYDMRKHFTVVRQALHWFAPRENPSKFREVFILPHKNLYGFGAIDCLVKVADADYGKVTDPDMVERQVFTGEAWDMKRKLAESIPAMAGVHMKAATCLYTKTPDGDFVIDWHPTRLNTIFVSACSGHGFKHSAAVGEIVAKMALGIPHGYDLAPFSFARFAHPAP